MPKTVQTPPHLLPYTSHGVELAWEDRAEALGDCPYCMKEGKLYVNAENGLHHCKSCGESGNALTFLRKLWDMGNSRRLGPDHVKLTKQRGLLEQSTLEKWGWVQSPLTQKWLCPGYSPNGNISNLYIWTRMPSKKHLLMSTTGLHHGIFGLGEIFDNTKQDVYICEGPWDAMALWEVLGMCKHDDAGNLILTGNPDLSLLSKAVVLAVPGASTFLEEWSPILAGKRVYLLYDSDHPKEHPQTKKQIGRQGWYGMKRAAHVMAKMEATPSEIHCVYWGPEGYDPSLPDGFDVRDHLTQGNTPSERVKLLQELLGKIAPIPGDWIAGRSLDARKKGSPELQPLPCSSYKALVSAWRSASFSWTPGIDHAVAGVLACCMSTKLIGGKCPVWLKVISPPSTAKSVIAEACAVSKRYVVARSTITGLHSGYKTDDGGDEDHSLIPVIRDKTLMIKDLDTLIKAPNYLQIISEFRDLYDGATRSHYRNKVKREYENFDGTIVFYGTPSSRVIDHSELGERFLDFVIMDKVDDQLEDEITWRLINRVRNAAGVESNGTAESWEDPAFTHARQLTAGYIEYLRENAAVLHGQVRMGDDTAKTITRYAKFVSYMRSKPAKSKDGRNDDEAGCRELSGRLTVQLGQLAMCLTAVLGKKEVDAKVLARIHKVALDTSHGNSLKAAEFIWKCMTEDESDPEASSGAEKGPLGDYLGMKPDRIDLLLRHLRAIGAVESFRRQIDGGAFVGGQKWRFTRSFKNLYQEVML